VAPRSYLVATLALCGFASHARAQDPITDNDFRVDLSQGLVLSGSRITGMGGAFTALATGIDGASYNPATYAARDMWEHKRFTWGLSLGLSFPGQFGTNDYFNSSVDAQALDIDSSFFLDAGLRIQVGYGGGGVLGTLQFYDVSTAEGSFVVRFDTVYAGVSGAFLRESLLIGAGVRVAHFQIKQQGFGGQPLIALTGLGPEVGMLLRPEGKRFRIGAALHLPVQSEPTQGTLSMGMIGNHFVPQSVNLPWQANVGIAFQLGERPMNLHWVRRPDPEIRAAEERDQRRCSRIRAQLAVEQSGARTPIGAPSEPRTLPHPSSCGELAMPRDPAFWLQESAARNEEDHRFEDRVSELSDAINLERWNAYDDLPRRHVIFSADVGVTGAVPNSIGVDAFLDQERRPRTSRVTPILAVGMEGEPWRNRLKVRVGSYLEPARNVGGNYRLHATGGLDLRLFRWALFEDNPWDFRIGFVFDVAPQIGHTEDKYSNFGITAGLWH
jgi:hypothetical protein